MKGQPVKNSFHTYVCYTPDGFLIESVGTKTDALYRFFSSSLSGVFMLKVESKAMNHDLLEKRKKK